MKAVISIPSAYGDAQLDFKSKRGEITDAQFTKEFREDYEKHKFGIMDMMHTRFRKNMSKNNYEKENPNISQLKYHYNNIDCNILDTNRSHSKIDDLIHYYQSGEQFAIILQLFNIQDNTDVDDDMTRWYKDAKKIMNAPSSRLTEAERVANIPKRDLKLDFPQSKSSAILKNCKIIMKNKPNEYVLIVEKITFVVNR